MAENSYRDYNFNKALERFSEVGFVETVDFPIVHVVGLPYVKPREVVLFESGELGYVLSLERNSVEVLVLSRQPISVNTRVARTNDLLKVPVGHELLGHVVDPLGRSLFAADPVLSFSDFHIIDTEATGVSSREKITKSLETGVTVVDLLVPLGKGQRELIIGDRKTGKTEFLLQTFLNQAKKGVVCIYAAVGKKKTDIQKIVDFVLANDIKHSSLIVASSLLDPAGLIYLTPYSAMSLAEYFRDAGKDVLLIMDDLTTHAKFYREIALLGKRFPGRGSYPGDIFYTHARLLERAGNFKTEHGTFSITCLPVAETVEGDISGYIQTNMMSITDGHVFFDKGLFAQGRRPAINYFLSVTRVGRQTQSKLRWDVSRELMTLLTLLEKTESFVHFGAELSEGVKTTLSTGRRLIAFFDQPMNKVIPLNLQIILFGVIWLKFLQHVDDVSLVYLAQETTEVYEKKEEFRQLVDSLVTEAQEINGLLAAITKNKDKLLSFIGGPKIGGSKNASGGS